MPRYAALLRGVNVGGKNKLAMAELRAALSAHGFKDAKTLLNSGNVLLSSGSPEEAERSLRTLLSEEFSLEIPVLVLPQTELRALLSHAPAWWGTDDPAVYDNLIFLLPPMTFEGLYERIGPPKEGLEQIEACGNAVFWSFSRRDYQKTSWWHKTARADVADSLTIRTAGTVRKLAAL